MNAIESAERDRKRVVNVPSEGSWDTSGCRSYNKNDKIRNHD